MWPAAALGVQERCDRATVRRESADERRGEQVETIGPPVVAERPQDLQAMTCRGLDHGLECAEVEMALARLDQVPANGFADGREAALSKRGIVLVQPSVMLGPG